MRDRQIYKGSLDRIKLDMLQFKVDNLTPEKLGCPVVNGLLKVFLRMCN